MSICCKRSSKAASRTGVSRSSDVDVDLDRVLILGTREAAERLPRLIRIAVAQNDETA
jgi:cell division septal protein FtsQ